MDLDSAIRKIPDFPKPGILFYDITSIFTNPPAFNFVVQQMIERFPSSSVDGVIAIEARGFLLGACYARECNTPLVLARKKGKLPGETYQQSYALEYGEATLEVHKADLTQGKRWLIIDDLIATGGTLEAVALMVEKAGAEVAGMFGIVGLPFLDYRSKIGKYDPQVLISYDSE